MYFLGLFNAPPPPEESQTENVDNGRINLLPSNISTRASTTQVIGLSIVPMPQGVQNDVERDMLSGAKKHSIDLSFCEMSNYGDLQTLSSIRDQITMMIGQQQIETDRLIEENAGKLRIELAGLQAQQVNQLVVTVREENLEKLKLVENKIGRMKKNNYFLHHKVKSLIKENQYLMNSVVTHEATIKCLQAQLLKSERCLLETNVTSEGAESCCGNNINEDQLNHTNVFAIDQDGYDIINDCFIMNQSGGYIAGDGGYNINQSSLVESDGGYIVNGGVYGGSGVGDYVPYKYKCKICGEMEASLLILPCNHLCLCPVCEIGLRSTCPVCEVHIESSFHVNRS